MKKTHSTNIGGTIFDVEDDAYQQLKTYLESVEVHFQSHPDAKDIVADIEGRIAEQLSQKSGPPRIVTLADVEQVIAAMGSVDQFGDAEVADTQPQPASATAAVGIGHRRLFRDGDERVIAGVAAGIAAYFDVSPLWIRLLFLASLFLGGSGLVVYLILWVCVPLAKTMTDKLRMRGEPITLATIDRGVRDRIAVAPPKAGGVARRAIGVLLIGAALLAMLWIVMSTTCDRPNYSWKRVWRKHVVYADRRSHHIQIDTLLTVPGTPTIDLSTIEGEIHVTTWPRAQVKVVASIDGEGEDLDFGVSGSNIHLKERLRDQPCQCSATYEVIVPVGASLITESVSGSHHIAGTHGPVRASSVSGDIEIADAGEVAAKTVSGDITLTLPAVAHATVEAQSMSGTIESDFMAGTAIDDGEGGQGRQVRMPINGGGAHVTANSVSGDISIHKEAKK